MNFSNAYNILYEVILSLQEDRKDDALIAFNAMISDYNKHLTEIKRQKHIYYTILETVREISLKALDTPRFEQYTINTLRGQFGVVNVLFLRQEAFSDPCFAVHTPRLLNPPEIKIPVDSKFATEIARFANSGVALFLDILPNTLVSEPFVENFKKLGIKLIIPLIKKDEQKEVSLQGLIGLGERAGGLKYSDDDIEMLMLLGSMVGITLHNSHLYHRSITDNLTKVFSRGFFDIQLETEISKLQKENEKRKGKQQNLQSLTLILIDLDDFKRINDTYGHLVGDIVLYEIANVMKKTVRKMDFVCRYGGEEFSIIVPDINYEIAPIIAERLRKAVEETKIYIEGIGEINITISVGLSVYPYDSDEIRKLINYADASLYLAKGAGKNQVVLYKDIMNKSE